MKINTLFILNLLASLFYVLAHNYFSQVINNIILVLIIILFIYTSEKIKLLNNKNSFTVSRFIILLACIALIVTLFSQPVNIFIYRTLLLVVAIGTEAYELFWKRARNYK